MNIEARKFRISDYFWPFGVSLLAGMLGLYLATLGLFALGVPITRLHSLAFVLPSLLTAWICLPRGAGARLKKALGILGAQAGAAGCFVLLASPFDDLSWDGMAGRIEPVLALSSGWNPIDDPKGKTIRRLSKTHPILTPKPEFRSQLRKQQRTFGIVLSANLANWSDNLNAGKAVNPLLILAAFGFAYGGLASLAFPRGWVTALALMAALNPVAISQLSSYYVDGHTAGLFTAMVFSAVRVLQSPWSGAEALALGTSFLALSAAKVSGIFYATIIGLSLLAFLAARREKKIKFLLWSLAGFALLAVPAGILLHKSTGFRGLTVAKLSKAIGDGPGYGYGGGASQLAVLPKLDRLQLMVVSYFAPTEIVADQVKTKPLFWFTRPELAVFESLTPDARAGGFGPLYGTFLVLSLGAAAMLFFWRGPPPPVAYFPLVPVVISLGLTQVWWPRWSPQGWLLPIGLLLPVIACLAREGGKKRAWLPALAAFTGIFNSGLILVFYSIGCVKAQRVLNSQLAFLKTFPQPLRVHMPKFPSNRIWFIREGINFRILKTDPPPPRLRLMRTYTTTQLPPDWEERLARPPTAKDWRKRDLIED